MTKANILSRRERQIMDILYRLEEASVNEVLANLDDPPSYSTVRALLGKLVDKGHSDHRESGPRYLYSPVIGSKSASNSAFSNIVNTFFKDSPALAVNSLLDMSIDDLSDKELLQLEKLIHDKKKAKR